MRLRRKLSEKQILMVYKFYKTTQRFFVILAFYSVYFLTKSFMLLKRQKLNPKRLKKTTIKVAMLTYPQYLQSKKMYLNAQPMKSTSENQMAPMKSLYTIMKFITMKMEHGTILIIVSSMMVINLKISKMPLKRSFLSI